jgi:hypothetical protein
MITSVVVEWIDQAQNKENFSALFSAVMNIWVPKVLEGSSMEAQYVVSQVMLSSMQLIS